jgi:chitinase
MLEEPSEMCKNDRCKKTISLTLAVILIFAAVTTFSAIAEKYGEIAYGLSVAASYHFTGKQERAAGKLSEAETYIPKKKGERSGAAGKRLVGYYAAWGAYYGFTPDRIDAAKLTHINYAFAVIGKDLKIAMGYPDKDLKNYILLNELKKKNPELKTLISIGGWDGSGRFSDAALTDASRKAFAESCVEFIKKYGFDGVDLDWEYPVGGGLPGNSKRPEDKQNFTLLLQKLREKLDEQGAADNRHYLLTIAAGAGSSYAKNVELPLIHRYLDYATIMTYDIHGIWDSYTDLLAPLYSNTDTSPQYKSSADSSIKIWEKSGFPMDKLIMGIPFYGYQYSAVVYSDKGLYGTFSGGKPVNYNMIEKNYLNQKGYIRYFHSQSKVPWLYNGSTFISYEDQESIGFKTDYIKTKGLGGAMVWELSQDPDRVLLNKLYNGLN